MAISRRPRLGVGVRKYLYCSYLRYNNAVIGRSNQTPATTPSHRRVLGLDVGAKRIGMAVSDRLGITAQGLETLQRRNKRVDFEALGKVIRKFEVAEIVVGYPLRMSGAEGAGADKMQRFAEELHQRFKLPVHLWDERLTSAQANRLLRETNMSIRRRGQVIDQMAAVLILQSWMDAQQRAGADEGIVQPKQNSRSPHALDESK